MSFWNASSQRAGAIVLKRNWRFLGTIVLNEKVTTLVSSNKYDPDADISTSSAIQFGNPSNVQNFLIHSFDKPTITTKIQNFGQNALNGLYDYQVDQIAFKEVSIEIYDTFSAADGSENNNSAAVIWNWLGGLGYDADSLAASVANKTTKSLEFLEALEKGGAASLLIQTLDPDGNQIESYKYYNPLLSQLSFTKLSYGTDSLPLINMTFSVAAAKYTLGGGN